MKANYFTKTGLSIGGSIALLESRLEFTPHVLNFKKEEVSIDYKDILGVELETIIGPMIRINLKDGTSRAFVVNKRKQLASSLTDKIT